ncbi:hypothetical protein HN992_01175 [Candidatus Woesearchaeota archaeon]|jgi:small subunit ribosomal protein S4e|nr:hypothetical protein [Candidatus Woesearchaeota archaeon]MBT3438860.1 hypothetical protein [Candidatus Woesearchaeota archaeon]MBT4058120.1 hypothetical protein [Candidatus Woesearchaeota archaeon]MBT4208949.1 hypothetical protein [Candidatus Woesearchaeota archaeon]MBT4732444.1 hypothetical protein [Candidatus Woesearchaeota archaeon]
MTHQKRMATSKRMPLGRKATKYLVCQSPGTHKKEESVSLVVALRDILQIVKTSRETKKILSTGDVLVNADTVKDHRFPIGFLDEISFPALKESYLVIYNQLGKFEFKKQTKAAQRPSRIIGKTMLSKGRTQLNLFAGKNIILDKDAGYKVGDSVVLDKNKVTSHFKLEKGAKVFLTAGKHMGHNAVVDEILDRVNLSTVQKIIVKIGKESIETAKEYAYVVGGDL